MQYTVAEDIVDLDDTKNVQSRQKYGNIGRVGELLK